MKRTITQKEFERKLRVWAIIVPLIASIIGSLTSITVAYIYSKQVRPSDSRSLDSLMILLPQSAYRQDPTVIQLDTIKKNNKRYSDSANGDVVVRIYIDRNTRNIEQQDSQYSQTDNLHFIPQITPEPVPLLLSLISNNFTLTVVSIALAFLLLYYIWNSLSRHIITGIYSVPDGNLTSRSS
jgi:hypothetical protein